MSSDSKKRNRYLALLPGPLFLTAAAYFYDQTGLDTNPSAGWQFNRLTRIGSFPLSLSDYYFLATVFCGLCGIIYFILGAVARRPVELFFGYLHSVVSLVVLVAVAHFLATSPVTDAPKPIPQPYQWTFAISQVALLTYAAMAILRPPPEY